MLIAIKDGVGPLPQALPPVVRRPGRPARPRDVLVPRVPEPEHRVRRARLPVLHHQLADGADDVDATTSTSARRSRPPTTPRTSTAGSIANDRAGAVGGPDGAARACSARSTPARSPALTLSYQERRIYHVHEHDRPARSASSRSREHLRVTPVLGPSSRRAEPMHPFVAPDADLLHRLHQLPRPVALRRDHGARLRVHIDGLDARRARRPYAPAVTTPLRGVPGPRPAWSTSSCSTATACACASASTARCSGHDGQPRGVARHRPLQVERHPPHRELRRAGLPRPMHAQLATGVPDPLEAAAPRPVDGDRTGAPRTPPCRGRPPAGLAAGDLDAARRGRRRRQRRHRRGGARRRRRATSRSTTSSRPVRASPFHVTLHGRVRGRARRRRPGRHVGRPASLAVAGVAEVDRWCRAGRPRGDGTARRRHGARPPQQRRDDA